MAAAAETAPEGTRSAAEVLAIDHLVKRFPGTIAVDDVSFAVERGAIHALVGENGAGKSTIIKVLSGVYQPDGGQILVRGEPTRIRSPHHAQELGVTTIHQEQTLIDSLTAIENVFLGREHLRGPLRRVLNIVDAGRMRREVLTLFEDFEFDTRQLGRFVRDLSGLDKQIVEIVKALAFRSEVIIMDEPTAGLTEHERVALFRYMRRLQDRATAILWVTHRLEELEGMADRVHVLRDARLVGTLTKEEVTPARVVRMMIGRDVDSMESFVAEQRGATVEASDDDEVLRVEGLSRGREFADVSFVVRRGEILGIGGLAGAGRTALARAIIGADRLDSGEILVRSKRVGIRNTARALTAGIAYVPKERKTQGILPEFSVTKNITMSALERFRRAGLLNSRKEADEADRYIADLQIRARSNRQPIASLSGGNQQKAIIARALSAGPAVILFDEPTQGVDIGAKMEIFKLINDYVVQGGSAVIISSEMVELLGLSSRVLVMRKGQIVGELPGYQKARGEMGVHSLEERFMALAVGARPV